LEDIGKRCEEVNLPLLTGGGGLQPDQERWRQELGVGNTTLMNAFNSFIKRFSLREVHREGPKFTWTNKQECPIMSNIDRVLVTTKWDLKFTLANLTILTRVGWDHCPYCY
jgi:hypothetical protein